jgi:uncharacterized repeat protein (TIGR02543 family)
MTKTLRTRVSGRRWLVLSLFLFIGLAIVGRFATSGALAAIDEGYRDFSFPNGLAGNGEPTGEKPESKLWWNDGFWWGSLWSTAGNAYHIHQLEENTQSWIDTGIPLDDRFDSRADVLWDGTKLYVVSHILGLNAAATTAPSGERGELFRYSYNPATDIYTLDGGFPVEVTLGKSETLVIDKDSLGTLWVTYVEDAQVMVNHSLNGNDATWGVPYVLPVGSEANVDPDDISSIIAYKQHVGIMWSNQAGSSGDTRNMYFAVHPDSAPDTTWTQVKAYDPSGDDHLNLKSLEADSAGNVFAVIKTSSSSALIVVLVCQNNVNACMNSGNWDAYPVYTSNTDRATRPILLIDETNRQLYVFTRNKDGSGDSGIYYKTSDMDNISFPSGIGTPFIGKPTDTGINDATSTKQNLNSTTGLVVLASDGGSNYYLHNYMSLGSGNEPTITSFAPPSGIAGTQVNISGTNFNGASQVTFNGALDTGFTVISDTLISAHVPGGTSTGKIRVTTPDGTATSIDDFIVAVTPAISSFSPTSGPPNTEVTLTGSGFLGVGQVTFNGTPATLFAVDSNMQIRANVPAAATTGAIAVSNASGSDTTSSDFTVTAPQFYTLTLTTAGWGSVTLNPPGGVYIEGTVVQLTANAGPGHGFSAWSGDLSGGVNPETILMDGNKSVTATFVISAGSGPPTHEETATGGSTGVASVTSGSLSGVNGHLYLASIASKAYRAVTSVSGLGLTWSEVDTQCGSRNATGVSVWYAIGTPTSGTVTANLASAPTNAVIAVSRYSGVNESNPIGANVLTGNTTGANLAAFCAGGTDSNAYSFNLTTNVDEATVYSAVSMRDHAHTPGSGYTERADITQASGGPASSVAVQDRSVSPAGTVTVDGGFDGTVDWAVVALSIEPGSGGNVLITNTVGLGNVTVDPPGNVYAPDTEVTVTATPDSAGWEFAGWSGDLSGTINPANLTMDGHKTVTATFSEISSTQYTLTVGTEGSGTVLLSPSGGVYNEGAIVTLTPAPTAGWTFAGWSGDLGGAINPETLTMNANKSVTATFVVSVQFDPTSYIVDEAVGSAIISVTLSATTGQTVTVDYASSDGTAVAIDDYTAVSGTRAGERRF